MDHNIYCRFMYFIGKKIFPKRDVVYQEKIGTDEVSIFTCNHSGTLGPCAMTAWFDHPFKAWSISYIYDKKIAPNFMFHDFFFARSKTHKKFYRFLSKLVAKLLPPLLLKEKPILVYRNSAKIFETFKESMNTLKEGKNLVIFPECPRRFSEFVNEFYDGFVDVARFYYKETGKCINFYPVYIPPTIRKICVGKPIAYNPLINPKEERKIIAQYLTKSIDGLGRALPPHKIVPFLKQEFYRFYSEFINDTDGYWNFCSLERSE